MIRARTMFHGFPVLVFGFSTENIARLQTPKPMLTDLRELGINAAALFLWGETEEEIQKDLQTNGLPLTESSSAESPPIPVLGPTGQYPQGKHSSDDRGELAVGVRTEAERVVIDFGTSVNWIALDADQALGFADLLRERAHELKRSGGPAS